MDGARKTEELEMYKEKLNAMRRQIKLQEEKAAEVKEHKQREDELKEEERCVQCQPLASLRVRGTHPLDWVTA